MSCRGVWKGLTISDKCSYPFVFGDEEPNSLVIFFSFLFFFFFFFSGGGGGGGGVNLMVKPINYELYFFFLKWFYRVL